jgi:GxxExxY protein
MRDLRSEDPLSAEVIGACIEVHRRLGPGLLESVYEHCLCRELEYRGIPFQRQVPLPIEYRELVLECGYRMDVLVGDHILVELKAVEELVPVHAAQVLTYLKLSHRQVGLLVNFNVTALKNGLRRLTLKL